MNRIVFNIIALPLRFRSNSTGSLVSMVSTASDSAHSDDPGLPLETYLELFVTVLVILNYRRRQKSAGSNTLLVDQEYYCCYSYSSLSRAHCRMSQLQLFVCGQEVLVDSCIDFLLLPMLLFVLKGLHIIIFAQTISVTSEECGVRNYL